MSVTILDAVGDYLVAQLGYAYETNLFLATMPDSPDSISVIYENAGSSPDFTMGASSVTLDAPMIQVITRGAEEDYVGARDRAMAIRDVLGNLANVTVSTVKIVRIEAMGSINPLGTDSHRRHMISTNYRCLVQR